MKFTILLLFLVACSQRKEQLPSTPGIETMLELKRMKPDLPALSYALADQPVFPYIKDQLDFTSTELFSRGNVLIYMIHFKNKKQIYAVKGHMGKRLVIAGDLLYCNMMVDERNGSIGLLTGEGAIAIRFVNGVKSVQVMQANDYGVYFAKHGGKVGEFCQREKRETFVQCFKAESDEFCDGFFSCVAQAINPQIPIVIALTCTCYAAPQKQPGGAGDEMDPAHDIEIDLDSLRSKVTNSAFTPNT